MGLDVGGCAGSWSGGWPREVVRQGHFCPGCGTGGGGGAVGGGAAAAAGAGLAGPGLASSRNVSGGAEAGAGGGAASSRKESDVSAPLIGPSFSSSRFMRAMASAPRCREQAGSDQLLSRGLRSAPDHASGCPEPRELRPARYSGRAGRPYHIGLVSDMVQRLRENPQKSATACQRKRRPRVPSEATQVRRPFPLGSAPRSCAAAPLRPPANPQRWALACQQTGLPLVLLEEAHRRRPQAHAFAQRPNGA